MTSKQSIYDIIANIEYKLIHFQHATINMVQDNMYLLNKLKNQLQEDSDASDDNKTVREFEEKIKFTNEKTNRSFCFKKRIRENNESQLFKKKQRLLPQVENYYDKKRKISTEIFTTNKKINM